ncbi:AAA family ATPase [Anaeromassilibacillus sp. SJQ-1]|uniref:AAA family ATPase n=1 Tax=Anaeromassilibacillus sp. SJQ-1 TaxID=3375419 RepID=UPI0039897594
MLTQLYIENIAVIERAAIDFQPGFNVLTGETGAGKSILIDSLHAVLGERTSRDLIRTGARSAFVSAAFCDVGKGTDEALRALGYTLEEDGTLLLQREINAEGNPLAGLTTGRQLSRHCAKSVPC